jgi:hypothetical protein
LKSCVDSVTAAPAPSSHFFDNVFAGTFAFFRERTLRRSDSVSPAARRLVLRKQHPFVNDKFNLF